MRTDERRDAHPAGGSGSSGALPRSLSALIRDLASPADAGDGAPWRGALRPGAAIGRFELVRELGRGGFGVVWEARDTELGRSVAFKAILGAGGARAREDRLLREAEVAARFSHPNIVTLHDAGWCDHGAYLVFELLRGETLARRLERGAPPVAEALRITLEVAKGVAHAHAAGVVHRDLKPGNVFLCEDGEVKVLDFGLAHAFGARKPEGGTPPFMAPEQWRGAPEDERTDVFALGVILYRMLAGALPFAHAEDAVGGVAPALEVEGAPSLGPLVAAMLEADPVRRPRDAVEVVPELAAALRALDARGPTDGAPAVAVAARPRAAPPRERGAGRARAAAVVAAVAVAALALGFVARSVFPGLRPAPPAPAERRLAVLPFRDVGGGAAEDAFADGLSELVTNKLRQLEQFRALGVVSTSDVVKEKVTSAKEAHAAFGATLALAGSVHWSDDRVIVAASLVDASTALVLAARDVEVPRAQAGTLQRLVLEQIAQMLRVEVSPEAWRQAGRDEAAAPGAYELYVQARGYLQRYDRAENLDAALAALDQALARDPGFALAHAGKAEAYLRRYALTRDPRFLDDARASADRAVDASASLPAVQLTRGLVQAAAGDHEEAIRSFERALELEPGNADALRELANAYDAAHRTADAEATFRRAIQLRPGSWATYKDLGIFYNRHGRLEEALPQLVRVVELTPDNYAGFSNLGGLYLRLGRRAEAAAALERSLALRPSARAYANLGSVRFYEARYAEAADLYRKAAALSPADARLWGNLGDAERFAGRAEEAAAAHRRAVALLDEELARNPGDAEPWARRAILKAALGADAAARSDLARALALGPDEGVVQFYAALVHEQAGRRGDALAALSRALAAGYSREEIGNTPALADLRRDPRYAALAGGPKVSNP